MTTPLARSLPSAAVARSAAVLVVAYVLLMELGLQLVFGRVPLLDIGFKEVSVPRGVFLQGAVVGLLYGLVALGIILVYRANRVVNFAASGLGAAPAVAGLTLNLGKDVPFVVALLVAVVGAALTGALVEVLVVRRFRKAPRLILSVATIGIGLLLAVLEFYVPQWLTGNALLRLQIRSPFQSFSFTVGIVRFTGDAIFATVVVLAAVATLAAFFRWSGIGIAVRAAAENADQARLLGVPVLRLGTVVWALAAVLSALGVFLRAGLVGLPVGASVGPSVLLFGLAAAVVAGLERPGLAMIAGMGLGAVEQTAQFSSRSSAAVWPAVLVVVLGALLLRHRRSTRAATSGVSSFETIETVRPIPSELRGLPEVVWGRRVLLAVLVGIALAAPYLVADSRRGLEIRVVLFAMIGISLVILTGWTGQVSLGQFAVAGVGAVTAVGMAGRLHADFFVTLLVAGVVGALVAVLIGLPALRIQGMFLAVTTLAFAFVVEHVVLSPRYFGWLLLEEGQFLERPRLYGLWSTRSDHRFYYVCLAFLALTIAFAAALRRNRGRVLLGLRDNERTLQAYGVRLATTRLAAFAISGFIAAVAGALLAFSRGSVAPSGFTALDSFEVFAMTVVGGVASVGGAVLGALFMLGIPALPGLSGIRLVEDMTNAAGLLLVLYYLPGGLAELAHRARQGYLRWVADRHGVRVPSLVADTKVEPAASAPAAAPVAVTDGGPPPVVDPDVMAYRDYVRLEGWLWLAAAVAFVVPAWPGLLIDYSHAERALVAPLGLVAVLALQAWRSGADLRRPGDWIVSRSLKSASAFRPPCPRSVVLRTLVLSAVAFAAWGPGWIGLAAWRNFDNDFSLPGVQMAIGLAAVPYGLFLLLDGVRVVSRHEAGSRVYVVGGHRKHMVLGGAPLLTESSAAADRIRETERASGALLACKGVAVAYDHVQVLFGCDIEVRPGEIVALLGTNGAGKSTLLNAVSGLVEPNGGVVLLGGNDITHHDPFDVVQAGITLVPGGRSVFPTLTVAEHLRLAGWLHRQDAEHLEQSQRDVLSLFPVLEERTHQRAGDLSGGEQQMLAVALALLAKPKLVMIDELSLGLAPAVVAQLMAVVRGLRDKGTAVLLVEQSLNVAMTMADRVYFMEKGEVRFEGSCTELLARDDLVRAVFLPEGESTPRSKARRMAAPRPHSPADELPLLEVRDVRRAFGGVVALDGVSLTVAPREIVGLVGANGAGKTTLLDVLSGFLPQDSGRIVFQGVEIDGLSPDARARLGLGRSFQDARLFPSLTVAENIAVALGRHLAYNDLLAAGCGLPLVRAEELDVGWAVADLVELLNLGDYRDKLVRDLSTGSRRVVDLAMAIAHDPALLLLDEPAAGIAQREAEALAPMLRRVRDEAGCALVIVEHDIPLISSVSERLVALDLGSVIADGEPKSVIADPRVVHAYLGGDPAAINRSGGSR